MGGTGGAIVSTIIYCDGAYSDSKKTGGYAFLVCNGKSFTLAFDKGECGTIPITTNRMELMAVIAGLESFDKPRDIAVVSDSKYVVGIIETWLPALESKPSNQNHDLLLRLQSAVNFHASVTPIWIPGHSGDRYHQLVNEFASREAMTWKNNKAVIPSSNP